MTHLGSAFEIYDIIEQIGDGSFGTVHKARNKISHKIVAVKVMKKKYEKISDCVDQFEPKLLHLMPPHINIVQMYDSCLSTCGDLSFIMEFMDGGNLYQLMRERKEQHLPLSNCELQSILHQILSAVSHVHRHNIFHRDMKPENLLIDYSMGKPVIKLADFGLAREMNSQPPYTEYISTRWYRAPEVLLRSTEYSSAVDMWAVGAIFAELITFEPLFPGESEVDQIRLISEILGSPGNKLLPATATNKKNVGKQEKRPSPGFARKKVVPQEKVSSNSTLPDLDGGGEWKEGVKLAYRIGFRFPDNTPKPLESVIPGASENILDILRHLLLFNPSYRWTADTTLKHAFFRDKKEPVHSIFSMEPITPPDMHESIRLGSNRGLYSSKSHSSIITPLDLLPIPTSPHSICPEWSNEYDDDLRDSNEHVHSRSNSIMTHIDKFLHDIKPVQPVSPSSPLPPLPTSNDSWLADTRPIYSSHQKIHPVTDQPHSPHYGKYRYASHQKQRLDTPVDTKPKSRINYQDTTINSHRTYFGIDHLSHHQLIKWTPPLYSESKRLPSRRTSIKPVDSWHHKDPRMYRMNIWTPSSDEENSGKEDKGFRFLPLQ